MIDKTQLALFYNARLRDIKSILVLCGQWALSSLKNVEKSTFYYISIGEIARITGILPQFFLNNWKFFEPQNLVLTEKMGKIANFLSFDARDL